MIQIQILEDDDTVKRTDYMRPLAIHYELSDAVFQFNCYSGKPMNNMRWTKVYDILGECWIGHSVKEIKHQLSTQYEFARGRLDKFPKSIHIPSDLAQYITKRMDRKQLTEPLTFGKYKGKTFLELLDYDDRYLRWLYSEMPNRVPPYVQQVLDVSIQDHYSDEEMWNYLRNSK